MMELDLLMELHALSQAGLTYSNNAFDTERYNKILEITSRLIACKGNLQHNEVFAQLLRDNGYITPKVDVRGAVFKEDKVLLVKEAMDDLWSLPGGWADLNYSPAENVLKEIKEETGLNCTVEKLVGIYDKRKHNPEVKWPHVYKIFFTCRSQNNSINEPISHEILKVDFFEYDHLPPLSLGRVTKEQIKRCFDTHNFSTTPPYFD
jgi:ADP-ribose pyrophosphatase YjhB (NUDIX family)